MREDVASVAECVASGRTEKARRERRGRDPPYALEVS